MAERKLKIQPQYRQLTYSGKYVPQLLLAGEWLHRCGFNIGERVQIIVKDQELIIKPLPDGNH